jgi:ferric-dicitrate binding protein FerR (iron transport regulator)
MMDCRALTNDVLTGRLAPDVRAHLDGCPACRARREELRSLEEGLAALGRALPRAENPALVRRIVARIPRRAAASNSGWRWAAAVAAAAVLLAAVLYATRETAVPLRRDLAGTQTPVQMIPEPAPPSPDPAPAPPSPPPVPPPAPELPKTPPSAPPPVVPPVPAPPPVESAPPAPKPAPPEAPKPAPPETRPARSVVAVTGVEGALELQDGTAWKKIAKGLDWDDSALLRSTEKLARFTLPDGTRATLRPHTELHLLAAAPLSLALEKGEAFFEVIPGPERRFSVVTPDARIQVTGTRFAVKRGDHTEVIVSAGEVAVTNDKGEVAVPAGTGTSVRKGTAPVRPRVVDADRAQAWRRELDGPELPRFRYDFEDGRTPLPWTNGKVSAGPARGFNRFCLEGGPGIDADLSRVDKRVATVHGAMRFGFRYWTADADQITIQFFSEKARDNFRYDLKAIGRNKWESVEIPLPEFFRLSDGSHPQEGDRFTWLNFTVTGATGPVYFDDIELVELQK